MSDGDAPPPRPPSRPSSSRQRLAASMRRSRSMQRLASDGEHASRVVLLLSLVVGITLGCVLPRDIPGPWGRASAILGWASTGCWFVGWYPQLITNFHARSVAGLSLDNVLLNLLGFACYSAYNGALFFSHSAREAYRGAHGGVDSDVRSNDVFFAFHALACTVLTAVQAARYDRGGQRGFSRAAALGCGAAALALSVYGGLWLAGACRCVGLDLLRFLNCLSYVKVCTTFFKYWPQIQLNNERKSTAGYNISNSITDLSGGLLSLSQQALDAWLFADITLVTGDLAKLGLAVLSMAYNVIILVQHYWTFAGRGAPESESASGAASPLLLGDGGGGGVGVEDDGDSDGDGEGV